MTESPRSGTVVTFYSYKGGVGRSMILANVAALLSNWGQRVLMLDWDLEAPGLQKYFQRWISPNSGTKDGVVDLVTAHGDSAALDWRSCLLTVRPRQGREIHLISAGKDDESYASRLRAINWERLFAEQRFGNYLEAMRREWKSEYDFILVDSRTGVTDIGGICTIHLPDVLVAVFTANEQSLAGVQRVLESARRNHARLPVDRRKLVVVPVPSRDETNNEYKLAEEWRARFSDTLDDFFKDWVPKEERNTTVLNLLKIPYTAYWSFGERIPVWEQEDPDNPKTLAFAYQPLARLLLANLNLEEARVGGQATEATQIFTAETEKARAEAIRLTHEAQKRAQEKEEAERLRKENERAERLLALEQRIEEQRRHWDNKAKSWGRLTWLTFAISTLLCIVLGIVLRSSWHFSLTVSIGSAVFVALVGFMVFGFSASRDLSAAEIARGLSAELQSYRSGAWPYSPLAPDEALSLLATTVDKNLNEGAATIRKLQRFRWIPSAQIAEPEGGPGTTAASAPVPQTAPAAAPIAVQVPAPKIRQDDYEYDLYVSYPRSQLVTEWLVAFLPLLSFWVGSQLGRDPSIYFDRNSLTAGDSLSNEMQAAIRGSRAVLAVLTPSYFSSPFCRAELWSFMEREGRPVVPIRFAGGDMFPMEIKMLQWFDFSDFAITGEAFKASTRYIDFQAAIQKLAPDVAAVIRRAPAFNPDAPVASPSDVEHFMNPDMSPPPVA